MNFLAMQNEVKAIVSDPLFDSLIKGYINESYLSALIEAKLPEYIRYGTVKTSITDNFINVLDSLDDFSGEVIKVLTSNVRKYLSLEEMIQGEHTDLGVIDTEIKAITAVGSMLWYLPIVSPAQSLGFLYIAKPDTLEYDSDEVTLFPEEVIRKVCIHGACALCFEKIEDALEAGDKLNTKYHRSLYEQGKTKLKEWNGRRRTHLGKSTWRH